MKARRETTEYIFDGRCRSSDCAFLVNLDVRHMYDTLNE